MRNVYRSFLFVWSIEVRILRCALLCESALLSVSPNTPVYLSCSQPVTVLLNICPALNQSQYSYICALLSTSTPIYLHYSQPVPVLLYTICALLSTSPNTPIYVPCSQPVPVLLYICTTLSQSHYSYICALLSASPSTPIYLPSSRPVPVLVYYSMGHAHCQSP
jgi:hypothetical protein